MPVFNVTIDDKYKLAGLTAAREAKNNSLVPEKDKDGKYLPIEKHIDYLATNQDYVQFVMDKACESYAKSFGYDQKALDDMAAKVADMQDKLSKM